MRSCRAMVLAVLLGLMPQLAHAEPATLLWRQADTQRWLIEVSVRTALPVTAALEHIMAVDRYQEHSAGQLQGSITRTDGRRYLVELQERRFGMPVATVSDTQLELTATGPAQIDWRAVSGLYAPLRGSWRALARERGGSLLLGSFEMTEPERFAQQAAFLSTWQQQSARPVLEGWLQLWVRALGVTDVGP